MTTLSPAPPPELSPAAQAVLDATDYPEDWATRIRVAAALRAASDQLYDSPSQDYLWKIASELDGANHTSENV
jgi:hypothetical protein